MGRNLTFCPESEVLWNVWLGDNETCVGRVMTIRGRRCFVAGEKGFPCGDLTFDARENYRFTAAELREISGKRRSALASRRSGKRTP